MQEASTLWAKLFGGHFQNWIDRFKTRRQVKILLQFNHSQQLIAIYALFEAKLRHVASRESVGGCSRRCESIFYPLEDAKFLETSESEHSNSCKTFAIMHA